MNKHIFSLTLILSLNSYSHPDGISHSSTVLKADELQNENITEFGLMNTKKLALTFDDGPGKGTEKILNLLKKYNIKATFFALGKSLRQYPVLAKRIVDEGHLLANHSYDHDKLSKDEYSTNPQLLINELTNTHVEIDKLSPNSNFYYFRAPYGAWKNGHADNANTDTVIQKYIGPVFWTVGGNITYDPILRKTVDAADWACWTKKFVAYNKPIACLEGYLNRINQQKGGVVLMHDVHSLTADMLELMLPELISQNYSFIRVDEIDELKNYEKLQSADFFKQRKQYFRSQNNSGL